MDAGGAAFLTNQLFLSLFKYIKDYLINKSEIGL